LGIQCNPTDGLMELPIILPTTNGVKLLKEARKCVTKLGVRWYAGSKDVIYLQSKEVVLKHFQNKTGTINVDGIEKQIENGSEITLRSIKGCIAMYAKPPEGEGLMDREESGKQGEAG